MLIIVFVVFGVIIQGYCVCKTPKLFETDDQLFLYYEMKYIVYLPIISIAISVPNQLIFHIALNMEHTRRFIDSFIQHFTCVVFTIIVTNKILRFKFIKYFNIKNNNKEIISTQFTKFISNNECYEQFMKQLYKELCIECLLCLTEIIQYRQYIDNITITDIESPMSQTSQTSQTQIQPKTKYKRIFNFKILDTIILPNNVPKSSIIYDKSNINDYKSIKKKVYLLYKKYIDTDSELAVNISYDTRKYLNNIIGNSNMFINNIEYNDFYKLKRIFDRVGFQLHKLILPSFNRFSNKYNNNDLV